MANPPSKTPLLTLLKQARAFGLGVVLATQNPVDLDYKGLSNTGTWFIGRLQTERDKARVLDGLEGRGGQRGPGLRPRGAWSTSSRGSASRVFLMNNVHEDQPVVFETRWAMSYLRGPLTRAQIKTLMDTRRGAPDAGRRPKTRAGHGQRGRGGRAGARGQASRDAAPGAAGAGQRPLLPPDVPQHFVPARGGAPAGCTLLYQPMLVGSAQVRVSDTKNKIDVSRDVTVLTADHRRGGAGRVGSGRHGRLHSRRAHPGAGGRCGLRRSARRRGEEEELRRLEQGLRGLAPPVAEDRAAADARR